MCATCTFHLTIDDEKKDKFKINNKSDRVDEDTKKKKVDAK